MSQICLFTAQVSFYVKNGATLKQKSKHYFVSHIKNSLGPI